VGSLLMYVAPLVTGCVVLSVKVAVSASCIVPPAPVSARPVARPPCCPSVYLPHLRPCVSPLAVRYNIFSRNTRKKMGTGDVWGSEMIGRQRDTTKPV
jgi:hypothetical protein